MHTDSMNKSRENVILVIGIYTKHIVLWTTQYCTNEVLV
jgi:hypothetical protein